MAGIGWNHYWYVLCLEIYLATSSLLFVGEATSNGGHNIVRALAASYERNTTSSNLREYVKEYIGVQVSHREMIPPSIHSLFHLTV